MSYLLGLTGSIGMGKSTTAEMFAEQGIPVWSADTAVHTLYDVGGAAVEPIAKLFPSAIKDGAVSRTALKELIAQDPKVLADIEAIVHPLVAQDRRAFIARNSKAEILLFDIPLLFETRADDWLDGTVCVTVPAKVQRDRVLARPGMTNDQLDLILLNQMPDEEKQRRADFVIPTLTMSEARAGVRAVLDAIRTHDA